MNKLNPGYKFLTLLIVSLILSFTFSAFLNMLVFSLCLLLTIYTPTANKKRAFIFLAFISIAAAGMFMSGFLFPSNGSSGEILGQTVYVASTDTAIKLSARMLAFGGIGILFALTTNSLEFIMSLMQQFRLPAKFAYGLLAAYHFFPVIISEYEIVRASLLVRGVKAVPISRKRLIPMLVHAFERSESIAMAMESRGFDGDAMRGTAFPVPLGKVDFLFMFLAIGGVTVGVVFL